MRTFQFILRSTLVYLGCLICCHSSSIAEPKKGGGFFNKEELDRGFFAEPTAEPTAEPMATIEPASTPAATAVPTSPPISNADIAREIVKGGSESIERLKILQSDPTKRDQLIQSLQGVKDNLDQQIQLKSQASATPDPRPTPASMVPPEPLNLLTDSSISHLHVFVTSVDIQINHLMVVVR